MSGSNQHCQLSLSFVGVLSTVSEKMYMMILEYHEKYGRRCNFSRRDRDFCFIILVFRDEIEIRYCYSHVSRRERETQIEFLKVEREKS